MKPTTIFRAPEAPLVIPEIALTPFLLGRAADLGDKPALIDAPSGRTLTYRGWADAVRKAAAGLTRRGFRKGDVFCICSPNLPEYAVAFHAASLIGGTTTTINPLHTATEMRQQLQDSGVRSMVTIRSCMSKVQEAVRESNVRDVFVFDDPSSASSFSALSSSGGSPPSIHIDPRQDVVALPYSSGTTGFPKGVMLTHHNLVANLLQAGTAMTLQESDIMLGVLPFFHIYGMLVIMNLGLHAGATVVTMPRFDLEQCLGVIQTYRITYAPVVPPIVLALAKHPLVDGYDLGSLHTLMSGAAPLSAGVARAAADRLRCRVLQGYGLTETSPVTHVMRASSGVDEPASIGPPVPNTEAKILDVATGVELGPRQQGELCVRGPQVMKGYLNRPEATAAMIDLDGWLHTGDVAYADEADCFFVVDRVKELIKYKGMQIAPAELEGVLLGHPSVADVAVIPLPHAEAGEIPKAFVVLNGDATPDDLMAYVAERVASYKRVRCLELVDQIPKSPSGKILRRVLIDREKGQA